MRQEGRDQDEDAEEKGSEGSAAGLGDLVCPRSEAEPLRSSCTARAATRWQHRDGEITGTKCRGD